MTRCPVCDQRFLGEPSCACRELLAHIAAVHDRPGRLGAALLRDLERQERIALYTARAAGSLPLFAQEPS